MDAFDFNNVKAEKAKAMLVYNRLRSVAKLFRLIEICLALLFLSWISSRIPFAIRISGEYFRQLIALIVSPLLIFLISNAIVITLLAKSGQIYGRTTAVNNAETDLYEEFTKMSPNVTENSPPVPEEIVYDDKEIISEWINVAPKSTEVTIAAVSVSDFKIFKRSMSENLTGKSLQKPCRKLRRSETEKCPKVMDSGENPAETANFVEELSNEDFQRTIEEFIAKQVKFHKEEKLAIVPVKEINIEGAGE